MEVRVTVVKDPGTGIAGTGASFGSNQGKLPRDDHRSPTYLSDAPEASRALTAYANQDNLIT
jgi:hypothetical protein